ncbi:MAG TPA: MaoC/PaaZ C-terminal domain-containing protein [Pseudonocardiaceae bacterium]
MIAAFDAASAEVGAELPEFVDAPATRTDYVRYQGASGDMNPIHHDEPFAREAGFPTVFAVGMLQAGILGSFLADLVGPEHVRRFKVQFREQSWPGDVITYGGRVVDRREAADGSVELDLELHATRQTGTPHLLGRATVTAPAR